MYLALYLFLLKSEIFYFIDIPPSVGYSVPNSLQKHLQRQFAENIYLRLSRKLLSS
jgi:hypothetical protein